MSKMPKFRAWDKKYKMLMRVNQIDFLKGTAWLEADQGDHETRHTLTRCFDDLIFMQYTGLKDKNGVAIFEWDIVQSTWYDVDNNPYKKKGEITYVGAQYVIVYDSQFDVETGEITYDTHNLTYAEDAEVIGNIYENPELLSSGIE